MGREHGSWKQGAQHPEGGFGGEAVLIRKEKALLERFYCLCFPCAAVFLL